MLKADPEIIVDDEIVLKRFSHDIDQIKYDSIVANHDHLLPWLPWADFYHNLSDMQKFTTGQIEDFDAGRIFGYDIFYKGNFAGSIDAHEVSEQHHYCYIGYWLDKKYTGKGIMTRSASALADYCFDKLGMHRVTIDAAPENEASVAVAKRLGFPFEARLKEEQCLGGKYYDTVMYTKIKVA